MYDLFSYIKSLTTEQWYLFYFLYFLFIYRNWVVDTGASCGLLGNLNINNVCFRECDKGENTKAGKLKL